MALQPPQACSVSDSEAPSRCARSATSAAPIAQRAIRDSCLSRDLWLQQLRTFHRPRTPTGRLAQHVVHTTKSCGNRHGVNPRPYPPCLAFTLESGAIQQNRPRHMLLVCLARICSGRELPLGHVPACDRLRLTCDVCRASFPWGVGPPGGLIFGCSFSRPERSTMGHEPAGGEADGRSGRLVEPVVRRDGHGPGTPQAGRDRDTLTTGSIRRLNVTAGETGRETDGASQDQGAFVSARHPSVIRFPEPPVPYSPTRRGHSAAGPVRAPRRPGGPAPKRRSDSPRRTHCAGPAPPTEHPGAAGASAGPAG